MSFNLSAISPIVVSVLIFFSGCSRPPEVSTAKAQKGAVESTVSSITSGTIRAEKVAELAFGAVGRVEKLNIALGDRVKEGQVLSEIENSDLKVAIDTAASELERRRKLYASAATSQSSVDDARRNYEQALMAYRKSLVIAPYDGLITELNMEVGQLSQITAIMTKAPIRIVDLNPRYIRAEIDEVDLAKVKVGMPARVKILAVRREPYDATVRKVIPFVSSVREQDRTSEIELAVQSPELLPVGASADVEVVVETKGDVLTVPTRAVLGLGESRYVYKLSKGQIAKTGVKLGLFNYDRAEILSGLSLGDEMVLPDQGLELKDGQKVRVR